METTEREFTFSERKSRQQNFDKRLIGHIIALVEQGVPRRDVIKEYGMSKNTLTRWIQGQNMPSVKRRAYTPSEKRSVVRAIAGGMGLKQARIAFNISSEDTIRQWIRKFKEENAEISTTKSIEVAKKTTDQSQNIELQVLQKALEAANLKIKALDTMIDIAEEQLKIDIRKKSGARQSSK